MTKRKKILIISPSGVGGAEKVLALYGRILSECNFKISYLLINQIGEEDLSLLQFIPQKSEIAVCTFRFSRLPICFFTHIKKNKPDIVLCAHQYYAIILMALKFLRLIPCDIVCRDNNMPLYHSKQTRKLICLFAKQARLFISQTDEMKKEMVTYYRIPEYKIVTIHNPIDREGIHNHIKDMEKLFPMDQIIFLYSGRIAPQKDIETLIKSFSIVKKREPNSHLYMIGFNYEGSEYTNKIMQMIAEYKLSDTVHILGFQINPHKYVAQANVFVLSSIYEGMPNAMLDAMYLGIPVATTTCIPYIAKVVKDGINGYTCEVKDTQGLANAMLNALSLPQLTKYIDINNSEKQIVEVFSKL